MRKTEDMLVTVITVCFNAAKTIETTIKSVVDQTYKNIEYIVIDGGSTDGTLQILEHYRKNIAVVVSEKDEGIYDAMNKGIELAKGDLIGIVNADDWYEKDAVEKVVQVSRNISEETGVISGQIRFMDGEQSFLSKKKDMSAVWNEMPVAHPATFIKKKIYDQYGKYDTSFKIAADYELIFRFYIGHVKFYLTDEILANFRMGGISSIKKNVLFEEDVRILRRYQPFCSDPQKVQESVRKKEDIRYFYQADEDVFENILGIVSEGDHEIFVFGCGYWGREFVRELGRCGIAVKGFLDNNRDFWGNEVLHCKIVSPEILRGRQRVKVVIAVQGDVSVIVRQILSLNEEADMIDLESVFERAGRICREQRV